MVRFIVGLLAYLFPYEVLAKIIVLLLERLAKATTFTNIDDTVVAVMKERLGMPDEEPKDDTSADK